MYCVPLYTRDPLFIIYVHDVIDYMPRGSVMYHSGFSTQTKYHCEPNILHGVFHHSDVVSWKTYQLNLFLYMFQYILHEKYSGTWKSFSMVIKMILISLGCRIIARTAVIFFLVKNGGFSWKSVLRYLCSSRKTILARLILTGPTLGRVLSIWSTNRL